MSTSPARPNGGNLLSLLRELLHLKPGHSLRESIADAIEEHHGEDADPDDLDPDERLILSNLLKVSDIKAGEIAVPRTDIIAMRDDSEFEQAITRFLEAGHSRLILYRKSLDDVIGMIHVKDIYAVLANHYLHADPATRPAFPQLATLARPVLAVPGSKPVMALLTEMRRDRTHMAIVIDEYGGTDGIVTIEDIVEEIVGEIEDEYDSETVKMLHHRPDGCVDAGARVELDELETELGVSFIAADHGDEVDTLGGLAFLLAGRIPQAGERLLHPNGWTIEVVECDGRRIRRLLLHPPAEQLTDSSEIDG